MGGDVYINNFCMNIYIEKIRKTILHSTEPSDTRTSNDDDTSRLTDICITDEKAEDFTNTV